MAWYNDLCLVCAKNRASFFAQKAARLEKRLRPVLERHDTLVDPATGRAPRGWLLPLRAEIRHRLACGDLINQRFAAHLLQHGDPRLRAALIWLLGRQSSRFRLWGIDEFIHDPDPAVRKHAARALRRLEAYPQLAAMASAWPDDPWVQRFATDPKRRAFSDRLTRFTQHSVQAKAPSPAPPMTLWARDRHWFLSPPKRADYLRRMLRRIQRWVRGRTHAR